jgi:peptidyl-prolyl cis-trans isomerase D
MLEIIRKNAQSWGVKLLFGIIVLVFVFWGVGSFRGKQKTTLAVVNDQEIPARTFMESYQRQLDAMRRQNQNVSADQLRQMDFKKQVFNQLVDQTLLLQEAEAMGFATSPAEISSRIKALPSFQDQETQRFDMDRYKALLRANRMSPAQFESDMGRDILGQKLLNAVSTVIRIREQEARDLFAFVNEKATIEYLLFADADFMEAVTLTDEAVKAYYQEHQEEFREPAKIAVNYLLLTPEGLAPYQEVSDQELRDYYRQSKDQFTRPERIKARHILIELPEDAAEEERKAARQRINQARERLDQGEDFAELAKELSQGPSAAQGGDLGWFSRGSMVEAFEDAAFALQPGDISPPVKTRFGLHLIKVEDRQSAGVQSFAEVKDRIRTVLAEDKAADTLEDTLDHALEIVLSTGDLGKTAQELGLELQTSGLFSRETGLPDLQLEQDALETLFGLASGEVTDRPLFLENGYLLAEKTDAQPARVSPFTQVRDQIVQRLTKQKARARALEAATQALEALQTQGPDTLPEDKTLVESQPFNRRGFIPGLGANPELARQALNADHSGWFDKPYQVPTGSLLARPGKHIPPDEDQWQEQKSFWMARLRQNREQTLYEAYFQQLRDKAEIEILSPELLQY